MKALLLVLALATTACSISSLRKERETLKVEQSDPTVSAAPSPASPSAGPAVEPPATQPPATMLASTPSSPSGDEVQDMQITLRTKDGRLVTAPAPRALGDSASAPTEHHAHAPGADSMAVNPHAAASPNLAPHRAAGPVPADKALSWLKNGNRRFVKGFLRADGQKKSDIQRLSKGQQPHSIVLSCSDSRVPPEIVFDQKLGELFVVRTAGPNLDPAVIASIEYAVEHLGSNLILVMGHTSCGAVKAALGTMKGENAGSPWLNHLVAAMHPRLKPLTLRGPASEGHRDEAWANVSGVGQELGERSKIVRDALESGTLAVRTAVYDLSHGTVEFR